MVIRPERLSIVNKSYRKNSSNIHFSGEISELVFQGETAVALVSVQKEIVVLLFWNHGNQILKTAHEQLES